ncbi:hypothetical protein [Fretibacterium sp. OH1220_COT-178]|uniref:hypothetical protein n=1 Tax=Fretibacterium sp. OH1220_COT-178 TaxID=2491047 RepID=UPI000F5F8C9E|nr:hypothetical protein [Fretibacterium sp. OH1220_COT-178]RRD63789.1 hypothetical protein EII26_10050 [Fretibacterium sp. OH1220_COT-178]
MACLGDDIKKLGFGLMRLSEKDDPSFRPSIEGIVETTGRSVLRFVPLKPKMTARLVLAWKKDALFSPAAEKFFELVRGAPTDRCPRAGLRKTRGLKIENPSG